MNIDNDAQTLSMILLDENSKRKACRLPKLPIEFLIHLSNDEDDEVRLLVAMHPNVPIRILEFLSADARTDIRLRIANNLRTPPHILDNLSNDNRWVVQIAIAKNPNTSIQTLKKLVNDKFHHIRYHAHINLSKGNRPQLNNIL